MLKFLAGLFGPRSGRLQICHSQIVVNGCAGAHFAFRNLEVRNRAAEIFLQEVEPAHLMTVCRESGHLTGHQAVRNAGIFFAAGTNQRHMQLAGKA